ncbi:hypothetical protein Tco_0855757 [Tanacetum coccineum]
MRKWSSALKAPRNILESMVMNRSIRLTFLILHARIISMIAKCSNLINPLSGSPTPSSDPVVASLSPSLTSFGDSDFILEEIDTFLASDDSTLPDVNDGVFDSEGDIRLIEELLNNEITNDLPPCNTPKLGRNGIRVMGALLHRSIAQYIYENDLKKSRRSDTLDLNKLFVTKAHSFTCS